MIHCVLLIGNKFLLTSYESHRLDRDNFGPGKATFLLNINHSGLLCRSDDSNLVYAKKQFDRLNADLTYKTGRVLGDYIDQQTRRLRADANEIVFVVAHRYAEVPVVRECLLNYFHKKNYLNVVNIESLIVGFLEKLYSGELEVSCSYLCSGGGEEALIKGHFDSGLLDVHVMRYIPLLSSADKASGSATTLSFYRDGVGLDWLSTEEITDKPLQRVEFGDECCMLGGGLVACLYGGEEVRFPGIGLVKNVRVTRVFPWHVGLVGSGRDGIYWRLLFSAGERPEPMQVACAGAMPERIGLAYCDANKPSIPRWLSADQFSEYGLRWWQLIDVGSQKGNTLRLTVESQPSIVKGAVWTVAVSAIADPG